MQYKTCRSDFSGGSPRSRLQIFPPWLRSNLPALRLPPQQTLCPVTPRRNSVLALMWSPLIRAGSATRVLLCLMTIPAVPAGVCDVLTASNRSYPTTCAEEDNINVPLAARSWVQLSVRATHPTYPVTTPGCGADFDAEVCCTADFSGCPTTGTTSYLLRSANLSCGSEPIWDDHVNAFWLCTELNWWRPFAMRVSVGGNVQQGHRLVLNSKIVDEGSYPEVLTIYEDGNVRIKPHPPAGVKDVCYGSSVILGPAAEDQVRPFVDIARIDIVPQGPCFHITYASGGTAYWCLRVNRQEAYLEVTPSPRTDGPVATFRSMWVSDGNADVDHLDSGATTLPIRGVWNSVTGSEFLFRRAVFSRHNISAPDISIRGTDVETMIIPRPWRHVAR